MHKIARAESPQETAWENSKFVDYVLNSNLSDDEPQSNCSQATPSTPSFFKLIPREILLNNKQQQLLKQQQLPQQQASEGDAGNAGNPPQSTSIFGGFPWACVAIGGAFMLVIWTRNNIL